MKTVAVIGGGISGIAATFYLRQYGFKPLLIEKDSLLGGRLGLATLGDKHIEMGGKNIGRRYAEFRKFAASLGHDRYEFFGINSSRVSNGKLLTVKSEDRLGAFKAIASRHSAKDVWRFGRLYLRVAREEQSGFLNSKFFNKLSKKHQDAPLSQIFSQRFCQDIIRAMVVRMNGAEPDETHIGNFGSNLRMLTDSYDQLSDGMQPLLNSFSDHFDGQLGAKVTRIAVDKRRTKGVYISDAEGQERRLDCDAVIMAVPAHTAANLLAPHAKQSADALRTVKYLPVGVIVAEYKRDVFPPDIRALVFGSDSPLSNAGAYGVNSLNVVRYTFSGRASRSYLYGKATPEDLLEIGELALARHFPVSRQDRINVVSRTFNPGLCAYTVNQSHFVNRLKSGLAHLQGTYLTGDYLMGTSIEACFRSARNAVAALAS